jgi:hypothetical protein
LDAIGFTGTISETLRRDLVEVYATRNVLVHNAGVADGKFLEACPWIGYVLGDEIKVTPEIYSRFCNAFCTYSASVLRRMPKREDGESAPPLLSAG